MQLLAKLQAHFELNYNKTVLYSFDELVSKYVNIFNMFVYAQIDINII